MKAEPALRAFWNRHLGNWLDRWYIDGPLDVFAYVTLAGLCVLAFVGLVSSVVGLIRTLP